MISFFDENQIYRIDHYLGKETVQNLLVFRFSNPIFESMWNNHHIDHIQITVSEDMGIGTQRKILGRSRNAPRYCSKSYDAVALPCSYGASYKPESKYYSQRKSQSG